MAEEAYASENKTSQPVRAAVFSISPALAAHELQLQQPLPVPPDVSVFLQDHVVITGGIFPRGKFIIQ